MMGASTSGVCDHCGQLVKADENGAWYALTPVGDVRYGCYRSLIPGYSYHTVGRRAYHDPNDDLGDE